MASEPLEHKLRRLHHDIYVQLMYGGYQPDEATQLLADYADTVIAAHDAQHPRPEVRRGE